MKKQSFILVSEEVCKNLLKHLSSLPVNGGYVVFVDRKKASRSSQQNSFMWALYGIASKECGHTTEELHDYMKLRVLGYEEKTVLGEKMKTLKGTSSMNVQEMNEFIEKVEALCRNLGCKIPAQEYFGFKF